MARPALTPSGMQLLNHWLLCLPTEPLELFPVGGLQGRPEVSVRLPFPASQTPPEWQTALLCDSSPLPLSLLLLLFHLLNFSPSPPLPLFYLFPFSLLSFPFSLLSLCPSFPLSFTLLPTACLPQFLSFNPQDPGSFPSLQYLHPGRASSDVGVDFITGDNFLPFHPRALNRRQIIPTAPLSWLAEPIYSFTVMRTVLLGLQAQDRHSTCANGLFCDQQLIIFSLLSQSENHR